MFSKFIVASIDDAQRVAEVGFAKANSFGLPRFSHSHRTGTLIADAADYLQLSLKRWKYYCEEGFAPDGFADAEKRIATDPHCELGFLLVAKCQVTASERKPLGFCFVRRLWTGRLVLDFLSVHPGAFESTGSRPTYSGIGSGLLASVAKLTLALGGNGMWGEATKNSHGFYQNIQAKICRAKVKEPVTDYFRFDESEMCRLASSLLLPETD